jgi:hypothetical protein
VHGFVQATSPITKIDGATVTGVIQTNATLTPSDKLDWQVQVPASRGPDVLVDIGKTATIAPGNYGAVDIEEQGALSLSSGTYFFDTLQLEAGGKLLLDTSHGPVIIYVRTQVVEYGGTAVDSTGDGSNYLLVYLGTQNVNITSAFHGTIVAPSASLVLGTPSTGFYAGTFFAQNLEVRTNTTVMDRPFSGWPTLGVCAALQSAEATKATQLGLDPSVVYPIGADRQIVLPVGPGGTIELGLRYESGTGPVDSAGRFRVIALAADGTTVLGGSTFVIRRE